MGEAILISPCWKVNRMVLSSYFFLAPYSLHFIVIIYLTKDKKCCLCGKLGCCLLFNFCIYIYFCRKYHCHELIVFKGREMIILTKSNQHQPFHYGVWVSHLKYLCCSRSWKYCEFKILKTSTVWLQSSSLLCKI